MKLDAIEGILIKNLEGLNPEILKDFIDKGVDLAQIIKTRYSGYISSAKMFMIFNPSVKEIAYACTDEDLLALMAQKRPDLHAVIVNHPNGRWWLSETLKRLKSL